MKKLFALTNKEKTVTLYVNTLSGNIVDIDVAPGETIVRFEVEKDYSPYKCSNIFLTNVKKQFPDVTTLEIGCNISTRINIRNEMFPNVRKVISLSSFYVNNTSMLIQPASGGNVLLNSFCLKADETLDLKDISELTDYSLSGCLTTTVANEEKIRCIKEHAFDGTVFLLAPSSSPLIMAGSLLVDILKDVDNVEFPNTISAIRYGIKYQYLKKAYFHSFNVFDMCCKTGCSNIENLVFDCDSKSYLSEFTDRTMKGYFDGIQNFNINNKYYKSIDGLLYSYDGKTLISCPGGKKGCIKVADGTEYILTGAFHHSHATEIIFPDSLKEIEQYAIHCCQDLTNIDFGKGIQRLGPNIACFCDLITEINIPQQVKIIDNYAFGGTYSGVLNLSCVHLHEGLRRIGENAFYGCRLLKDISLPASVVDIGEHAFSDTEHITLMGDKVPHGLIHAFAENASKISASADEDISAKMRTLCFVHYHGKTLYFPKYMSSANILRINQQFDVYGIDEDDCCKLYETAGSTNARQDIAAQIYIYTKDENIGSYLRKVGGSYSKRLLKEGREEELVVFLKEGLMTLPAMKKILQEADKKQASVVSAYLLKAIADSGKANTSLKL